MAFNLIKVTRTNTTGGGSGKRAIPDVSAALNKYSDLTLVLSPAFFEAQEKLAVGSRILIGFDPETNQLVLIPAVEGETEGVRTIRKRPSLEGAGTVFLKADDLPGEMQLPSGTKRTPVEWTLGEDNAVYITMIFA